MEQPGELKYLEPKGAELREGVIARFSPDGKFVVAGASEGQTIVFDWINNRQFEIGGRNKSGLSHQAYCSSILFHPEDPTRFFSGGRAIIDWNIETESGIDKLEFHRSAVVAMKKAKTSSMICSADSSGHVSVWHAKNPQFRSYCRIPWPVNDIAWCDEDQTIIAAHSVGVSKIDSGTMKLISTQMFDESGRAMPVQSNGERLESSRANLAFGRRNGGLILANQ